MRKTLIIFATTAALFFTSIPTRALEPLDEYLRSSTLADPAALIVDPSDGKVILEKSPDSLRTPASLTKLISTTSALYTIGTEKTYTTSIWRTKTPGIFVLKGGMDPWLTTSSVLAEKNKQRYLPGLVFKANTSNRRTITIYYSNMYKKDLTDLTYYLRKYKKVRVKSLPISIADADLKAKEEIATMTSEPITTMVSHAILWSVNELADRLGKEAVKKVGNPVTPEGITKTYTNVLKELGIDAKGLYFEDGSGLSKATKVTPRVLVSLLMKIRHDSRFQAIYDGLPVSGVTGTLLSRFKTAPNAVGHIHAKTGLLRTVASMAGYIDAGDREYVFTIIADEIKPGSTAQRAAKKTLDEMLGTFLKEIPQTP